jgi:hypothetical protein
MAVQQGGPETREVRPEAAIRLFYSMTLPSLPVSSPPGEAAARAGPSRRWSHHVHLAADEIGR